MLIHAPTTPGHPFNEDWPLEPGLPYRDSKIEAERLVLDQHGGVPVVL